MICHIIIVMKCLSRISHELSVLLTFRTFLFPLLSLIVIIRGLLFINAPRWAFCARWLIIQIVFVYLQARRFCRLGNESGYFLLSKGIAEKQIILCSCNGNVESLRSSSIKADNPYKSFADGFRKSIASQNPRKISLKRYYPPLVRLRRYLKPVLNCVPSTISFHCS